MNVTTDIRTIRVGRGHQNSVNDLPNSSLPSRYGVGSIDSPLQTIAESQALKNANVFSNSKPNLKNFMIPGKVLRWSPFMKKQNGSQ
jgi:hypothetical protein